MTHVCNSMPCEPFGGIPVPKILVLCSFLKIVISGFRQNYSQGLELIKLYEQFKAKIEEIKNFTIYQNYTLALSLRLFSYDGKVHILNLNSRCAF